MSRGRSRRPHELERESGPAPGASSPGTVARCVLVIVGTYVVSRPIPWATDKLPQTVACLMHHVELGRTRAASRFQRGRSEPRLLPHFAHGAGALWRLAWLHKRACELYERPSVDDSPFSSNDLQFAAERPWAEIQAIRVHVRCPQLRTGRPAAIRRKRETGRMPALERLAALSRCDPIRVRAVGSMLLDRGQFCRDIRRKAVVS